MRDFYCLPRDPAIRFPRYVALVNPVDGRIRAPLTLMNPMAKELLWYALDNLLACGVDDHAPRWVIEMAQRLGMNSGFSHGIVVVDDVAGGWTERVDIEMSRRFAPVPPNLAQWCTTILFAADTHTCPAVELEVRATVIRRHWQACYGTPHTLRHMLAQEQLVFRLTGNQQSFPGSTDLDQTALINCALDDSDYPLLCAALLGDSAAGKLGYASHGFTTNAGLEYAANPLQQLLMPEKQACFLTPQEHPNAS
jgi:hypothetical protein